MNKGGGSEEMQGGGRKENDVSKNLVQRMSFASPLVYATAYIPTIKQTYFCCCVIFCKYLHTRRPTQIDPAAEYSQSRASSSSSRDKQILGKGGGAAREQPITRPVL